MKVFAAVTLVVFLCCLELALSYPRPAARTQERIAGHQRMAGPQEHEAAYISTELCMQLYASHPLPSVTSGKIISLKLRGM